MLAPRASAVRYYALLLTVLLATAPIDTTQAQSSPEPNEPQDPAPGTVGDQSQPVSVVAQTATRPSQTATYAGPTDSLPPLTAGAVPTIVCTAAQSGSCSPTIEIVDPMTGNGNPYWTHLKHDLFPTLSHCYGHPFVVARESWRLTIQGAQAIIALNKSAQISNSSDMITLCVENLSETQPDYGETFPVEGAWVFESAWLTYPPGDLSPLTVEVCVKDTQGTYLAKPLGILQQGFPWTVGPYCPCYVERLDVCLTFDICQLEAILDTYDVLGITEPDKWLFQVDFLGCADDNSPRLH